MGKFSRENLGLVFFGLLPQWGNQPRPSFNPSLFLTTVNNQPIPKPPARTINPCPKAWSIKAVAQKTHCYGLRSGSSFPSINREGPPCSDSTPAPGREREKIHQEAIAPGGAGASLGRTPRPRTLFHKQKRPFLQPAGWAAKIPISFALSNHLPGTSRGQEKAFFVTV